MVWAQALYDRLAMLQRMSIRPVNHEISATGLRVETRSHIRQLKRTNNRPVKFNRGRLCWIALPLRAGGTHSNRFVRYTLPTSLPDCGIHSLLCEKATQKNPQPLFGVIGCVQLETTSTVFTVDEIDISSSKSSAWVFSPCRGRQPLCLSRK